MASHQPRHLECRDLGHAWQYEGDMMRGANEFRRALSCMRCGTTRTDRFTIGQGTVSARGARYVYANGYLVPGGLSRGQARALMWFPRTTKEV